MEKIIANLALIHLLNFCRENHIPANGYNGEGTHCKKMDRGFTYGLVSAKTGEPIVIVTFKKTSVPEYLIHK